ncbi:hypothetical protein AB0D38_10995 [Streptomyces sp. NPDC048279]|uniref:hypothetical protein n=1 Tax=Streptomyces sp. NPDC048279 TaxID=3154714 RepID=UPI00341BE337
MSRPARGRRRRAPVTAQVANDDGGTDPALSAPAPAQTACPSGRRVSSLTSYASIGDAWHSTPTRTNVPAAGTQPAMFSSMAALAIRLSSTWPKRSDSGENSSLVIRAPLSISVAYDVCSVHIRVTM